MESDIAEILLTEEQIAQRVAQLADRISTDYAGQPLMVVGVLTGAAVFAADLIRRITLPLRLEFVRASSYRAGTVSSGTVAVASPLAMDLHPYHVLLVEDIVDTGFTARYLLQTLAARGPNSLALCTLLDRTSRRIVQVPVEFRCFEIPDRFVIGFGLDFKQLYRNLGCLAVMKLERNP